jgi:hypothetical protein
MEWVWRHILTMDWLHTVWQKNYSHIHRRNTGVGLWPSAVLRGAFLYPVAVKTGCRQPDKRTQEWLLYAGVCAIFISGKFPNTVSQLFQEALSMEQQWCGKTQISIHPQEVQQLHQYLMKTGHLYKTC